MSKVNRTQAISQRGMKEVVKSRNSHKPCNVCNDIFECNLENFPKNATVIRDGVRITYLRASCRACYAKRPNRVKKAKPEQYRKNSLAYYERNRRLINWKKRRKVLWRKLDKMFQRRMMINMIKKE